MAEPTPGATGDAGDAGQSQTGDKSTPDSSGAKDSFTKTEVEDIVKARLASAGKKYADYDDLKSKAEEFDKLQDAQKSELQKAQDAREKAESQGKQAVERANNSLIKAEFKVKASEAGLIDPDIAFALADRKGVSVDDEGNVSGVDKAIKGLLEAKPHLASRRATGDGGGGPRGGSRPSGDMNALIREKAGRA